MAEVLIAARSARVRSGSALHRVHRGRTTAHPDARIVADHPDLWRPLVLDFPAEEEGHEDLDEEEADAEPGTHPGEDLEKVKARPAAKDVRAWAREQGYDVPAKGKIPDDVYTAYEAEAEAEAEG